MDMNVISEAFPKKVKQRRPFSESRIYLFMKTLDELKHPKPRSRRSASFSGARKSAKVAQPASPAATMHRPPKARLPRRLSRSNGNIDKAGIDNSSGGVENHGFDDHKDDEIPKKQRTPKILNRSLESICTEEYTEKREVSEMKEKVYDWLPFFKSRRNHTKVNQPTRRSASLDRNHCVLEQEKAEAALRSQKVTTPPIREAPKDVVFMHPQGPLPAVPSRYQNHRTSIAGSNPALLSRGRMYESIMRRSSVVPVADSVQANNECSFWKTELLGRLEQIYDRTLPCEWASKVDGYDIQWNMIEIDHADGIVKSRCQGLQPDYPQTVIQFMDYLVRYPFVTHKKMDTGLEYNVNRIFITLVNRLEDLNAPLQFDECSLIVNLLCKIDSFAAMLDNGPARRWSKVMISSSASSIEEAGLMVDGFSRDLPACGIRASKYRRRALSPFDNRVNLEIQDEKSYEIREQWLIEAIQLVLLSLPTSRRRKLHKFVTFIQSIETNAVFDLADPSNGSSNNREAAIIGLWTGVCSKCRKQQGMLITAVLLANFQSLFAVPVEFIEQVKRLECEEKDRYSGPRYAKITRSRNDWQPPVPDKPQASPAVFKKPLREVACEKTKKGLFTRLLRK